MAYARGRGRLADHLGGRLGDGRHQSLIKTAECLRDLAEGVESRSDEGDAHAARRVCRLWADRYEGGLLVEGEAEAALGRLGVARRCGRVVVNRRIARSVVPVHPSIERHREPHRVCARCGRQLAGGERVVEGECGARGVLSKSAPEEGAVRLLPLPREDPHERAEAAPAEGHLRRPAAAERTADGRESM